MARYRILVLAHRPSTQAKDLARSTPAAGRSAVTEPRRPGSDARPGSAVMEVRVVRAPTAADARDLALMQVMAASALLIDAPVVTDAVLVERLRLGRRAVREHLRRDHPMRAHRPGLAAREQSVSTHVMRRIRRGIGDSVGYCLPLTGLAGAL